MNASENSVANRPLSLATHLRAVATHLRNNTLHYDWKFADRCNCGLLARSILGISAKELAVKLEAHGHSEFATAEFPSTMPTWRERAANHCPLTGIPRDEIFRGLHAAGLQFRDYTELENQSNAEVREQIARQFTITETKKRMFRSPVEVKKNVAVRKDDHLSLIAYLESWARLIEEYHAAHATTEQHLEVVERRPLVLQ